MKTDDKKEPFNPPREPSEVERAKASGPVYRLRTQHVLPDGRVLEPGTVVGADEEVAWDMPPTNNMEGVNDAGREEVNKLHQRLYGSDAPWHNQPGVEEDLKTQEQQRKEEAEAVPVSHAQAVEQDKKWEGRPDPVVQARIAGTPTPAPQTISGTPGGPGVATPKIEAEDPRPTKPLEEQLPKT